MRSETALGLLLAASAACVASASRAYAEERFVWQAPAACPGSEAVLDAVAELAGPRPVDLAPFDGVRGEVKQGDGEWQLTLTLVDGARERSRRMTAPSCDELVRAAGLALALALDDARPPSQSGARPADAAPAPADTAPPVSARARDEPAEKQPSVEATRKREPLSFALLGEAVLDAGALPGPAPGLGGAVGVRAARWSASGFGLLLPARSTTAGNGGRAEFALLAAGVRGCYALAAWSVRPSACVGIELGRVSAAGVGLAGAASFGDAWLGSSAGAELRAELGASWFWAARGEAVVPIFRERYFVDAGDWVHRAALPGFRLALGVGVELR